MSHVVPDSSLWDQRTAGFDRLSLRGESYVQVACIQLHLLLQLCEQLVVEGLELQDREKGPVQRGQMDTWCQFGLESQT